MDIEKIKRHKKIILAGMIGAYLFNGTKEELFSVTDKDRGRFGKCQVSFRSFICLSGKICIS